MAEHKQGTLANFLVSALDMEDEINSSIYNDYMNAKSWPKKLTPEAFESIRKYLEILIEDTKRHKATIQSLIEKHG